MLSQCAVFLRASAYCGRRNVRVRGKFVWLTILLTIANFGLCVSLAERNFLFCGVRNPTFCLYRTLQKSPRTYRRRRVYSEFLCSKTDTFLILCKLQQMFEIPTCAYRHASTCYLVCNRARKFKLRDVPDGIRGAFRQFKEDARIAFIYCAFHCFP